MLVQESLPKTVGTLLNGLKVLNCAKNLVEVELYILGDVVIVRAGRYY